MAKMNSRRKCVTYLYFRCQCVSPILIKKIARCGLTPQLVSATAPQTVSKTLYRFWLSTQNVPQNENRANFLTTFVELSSVQDIFFIVI